VGTFFWSRFAAVIASLGVILAAAYMLWMVQRVAFGVPSKGQASHLSDLNWREMAILAPLAVLVFWIGVYPSPLLTPLHQTVNRLVERIDHDKGGHLVGYEPSATLLVPSRVSPLPSTQVGSP
jgi:NADH-quinone oxidoreductase subunit M